MWEHSSSVTVNYLSSFADRVEANLEANILLVPPQDFFTSSCWNHSPFRRKQLQTIVFDRIVAGRNLNSTGRPRMPYEYSGGWRCLFIKIQDIATPRRQRLRYRVHE